MGSGPGRELERKLGLFPVTNVVIANMVGSGIFTTSGLILGALGDPLLMLALWVAGGGVALCGALTYGALGAEMPEAGGEYVFLSRLYHPLLGFLAGWTSFLVGFSAPIAASAIGCSEYFFQAYPRLLDGGNPALLKKALSVGVILLFTGIHMRGAEFGTRVQNVLTLFKMGLIACMVVGGLLLGSGSVSHFAQGDPLPFSFGGMKTTGLSLMWILFAYSGWNAATYIGSEIRDPERTLPRSLLLGTGAVVALYLLVNVVFVYAVPPAEMKGVIAVGGLAMEKLFGRSMGTAFSLLVAFALFSSLSAFLILGPRVYYSMAKDRLFFGGLAAVNPATGAPGRSIALQGAVSSLMALTGTFDQILTVMGFALGIFPLLAAASVFRLKALRAAGPAPGGKNTLPGYPWAPAAYLAAGTGVLFLSFFERPVESSLAVGCVLSGVPVYLYFKGKGA